MNTNGAFAHSRKEWKSKN